MYREQIRANYDRLSKSQKKIADFLMSAYRDAAFMTASRLATYLDVDVATVTRFAQRLGYPGYPELLAEVQATVREEMSAGFQPVEGMGEGGRNFLRALAMQRENMERTISHITPELADQVVTVLDKAQTIYTLGSYTARLVSHIFCERLHLLGVQAVSVPIDTLHIAIALRDVRASDALVGIGFSGYSADVAAALSIARERGAKTIAITGSDVSPLARAAEIVIVCASGTVMHVPSEVMVMAVADALHQALAATRQDALTRSLAAFETTYGQLVERRSATVASLEENFYKVY